MAYSALAGVLWLASLTLAAQPSAPGPIAAPLRDLQFGDINFLHTTDTHGWHAGHLQEPSYGADWGDYIDFSDRLREQLEAAGQDLLIIDTGDRIEGNGLYDGDEPKGRHTFEIFTKQHMDIICVGNHELYKANSSENELNVTVPAYRESYIASNLDILNADGEWIPLAQRYRKFTTRIRGIRIMAFGFIFDFQRNDHNTRITTVQNTIEQDWFKEAIKDYEIDLFVVIGHVAMNSYEFPLVHNAIRSANPDTPIQFFGGHFHIRDARRFDDKSYGLASGRFMETIGFQSITGIVKAQNRTSLDSAPTFSRRYIDNNLYSFYHHTGLNSSTFHSARGQKVSKMISDARHELELDSVFGCAPKTYWMQRVPFPSPDSVFTLLNETVIPEIVVQHDRSDVSRLILVNTGAIRFDIFKGPFTKDSTFIVSPFTSGMHYIPNVPLDIAAQLLPMINRGKKPTIQTETQSESPKSGLGYRLLAPPEQYGKLPMDGDDVTDNTYHQTSSPVQKSTVTGGDDEKLTEEPTLTPGYVTNDQIDAEGDDTIHTAIPFYVIPNVMQTYVDSNQLTTPERPSRLPNIVDLIFNEFLQPDILDLLKTLKTNYTKDDVKSYMEGENMTDMISRWIAEHWAVNCKDGYEYEYEDNYMGIIDDEL